jgi:hypothetical protein
MARNDSIEEIANRGDEVVRRLQAGELSPEEAKLALDDLHAQLESRQVKSYRRRVVLGLGIILGLIVANYMFFQEVLELNYFRWYLDTGPLVHVVFALIALGLNLDKNLDLIAVRPNQYIYGCLEITTQQFMQLAGGLGRVRNDQDLLGGPTPPKTNLAWDVLSFLFHAAITLAFSVAFFVAALAWLLLVAPIQYPLYIFCGAPARMFAGSTYSPPDMGREMVSEPDSTGVSPSDVHGQLDHQQAVTEPQESDDEQDESASGLLPTGFATRPVTFTASLAALVLEGLSRLL